jgi:hypothetical protein
MQTNAFISYSHVDADALERLHKHLAMLRRESVIIAWTDHQILPGDRLDDAIMSNLEGSNLFLALVSPDYLASNYCYEREFQNALGLAKAGRLRIVPIIVEPCEWQRSPFGELMALPKDGKPISEWTNPNNALLDVVAGLRRLLVVDQAKSARGTSAGDFSRGATGRRVRLKQDFDAIQRADYANQAFDIIRRYFDACCSELNEIGEASLKARFELMNSNAFACTVVNRAKRGGEAHITIRNNKGGRGHFGDITYVHDRYASDNTSNGHVSVEADDYELYLAMSNFSSGRSREQKYAPKEVAEKLWLDLLERGGIEYED